MEKTVQISLLFDFYGELLTDKQQRTVDLYHNDNLSLGEIAELEGISRQAVRDTLLRAEAVLTETEEKTHLMERYRSLLSEIDSAQALVRTLHGKQGAELESGLNRLNDHLEAMKL